MLNINLRMVIFLGKFIEGILTKEIYARLIIVGKSGMHYLQNQIRYYEANYI